MPEIEKQCVVCRKSCVGHPRIKNAQGQYAHRACVDEKGRPKAPAQAKPDPDPDLQALGFDDDGFGDMGDLLDDISSTPAGDAQSGLVAACPSCGVAMQPGTVVCMQCGYNTNSGKALKTKSKNRGPGEGIGGIAGKAGGAALAPFLPIIGACIAGVIGAAAWAAIAYFTGYELGILAWIIGGLVGFGALVGARGNGNMLVGLVAAVVAIGSILGGKYTVTTLLVNQYAGIMLGEPVDESDVLENMAYATSDVWVEEGREMQWPDPNIALSVASWPEDYPQDLQDATIEKWNSFTEEEKQSKVDAVREDWADYEEDTGERIDSAMVLQEMVDEIANEWITDGRTIDWPDQSTIAMAAQWPNDYPQDFQQAIYDEWNALSPQEQQAKIDEMQQQREELSNSFRGNATSRFFFASFGILDIVFFLFAIGTAYQIGAQEG